jgi:hypothetical protein
MHFLHFINCFYLFQHPEPIVLNRVALKIAAWRPDDEPGPGDATGGPCSSCH